MILILLIILKHYEMIKQSLRMFKIKTKIIQNNIYLNVFIIESIKIK